MRLRGPSSEGGGGVGGAPPAPPLPGSPRGSKGRRGPFTNEDLKMGGGRLSDSASPRRDAARRLRRAPCACLRQQRLIRRRAWGRGAHRARLAGGRTNPRQAAPVCYADVLINPIGPALTRLPPGNRHLSSSRAHLGQPWVARPRHLRALRTPERTSWSRDRRAAVCARPSKPLPSPPRLRTEGQAPLQRGGRAHRCVRVCISVCVHVCACVYVCVRISV